MQHILLNAYTPGIKFRNFPDLDLDIAKYYDRVYDTIVEHEITPRYFYETGLKICFRDIFYYIDMLYDNQPTNVIDVGCGECIWKRWFPDIIGFDPNRGTFSNADFFDFFDEDFSKGHQKKWCNGMALNSLHFIDWKDIEKQIALALDIVKGRFLFTFNFEALRNAPSLDTIENLKEFHSKIDKNFNIIMFDSPLLRGVPLTQVKNWGFINGTVRFMLSN